MSAYALESDFPHCLNISGGKSSAYMLRQIIDANGFDKAGWPDDVRPVFTNTGREMEQTYEFLHKMETRWNVPLVWIELSQRAGGVRYKRVDHETASRNGEPFKILVDEGKYLPTKHRRCCTHYMKVYIMKKYMKDNFAGPYNSVLGYRFDEQNRNLTKASSELNALAPMRDDPKATRPLINAWWETQDFQLNLPIYQERTLLGNCDLCFLKGKRNLIYSMRLLEKLGLRERIQWWINLEGKTNGYLHETMSYADMHALALDNSQPELIDDAETELACHCTD